MDRFTGKYKTTGIIEIIDIDIFEQLLNLDIILIKDEKIIMERYEKTNNIHN
jgi:hypothetical protein